VKSKYLTVKTLRSFIEQANDDDIVVVRVHPEACYRDIDAWVIPTISFTGAGGQVEYYDADKQQVYSDEEEQKGLIDSGTKLVRCVVINAFE
jgi:hypothetical protein